MTCNCMLKTSSDLHLLLFQRETTLQKDVPALLILWNLSSQWGKLLLACCKGTYCMAILRNNSTRFWATHDIYVAMTTSNWGLGPSPPIEGEINTRVRTSYWLQVTRVKLVMGTATILNAWQNKLQTALISMCIVLYGIENCKIYRGRLLFVQF